MLRITIIFPALAVLLGGCTAQDDPEPVVERAETPVPESAPTDPEPPSLTLEELLPDAQGRRLLPGEVRPEEEERRHLGDKMLRKVINGEMDVERLNDSDRVMFEEAMERMRERERAHLQTRETDGE